MATTPKGIYYPNDYNEIADIPEDMKKMAESIEEVFEDTDSDLSDIKEEQTIQNNRLNSLEVDNTTNKSDILTNKQEINNIKTEQTTQNNRLNNLETDNTTNKDNISANTQEINNIKQEQTTQNTNISTNATNIESLQEENENLKKIVSQLPQVTGQGTSITLENTIEAPFTIFDVEGNSTQETTEGKNKFHIASVTPVDGNTTYNKITNNEIEVSTKNPAGYRYVSIPVEVEANTTYYFKANIKNSNSSVSNSWLGVLNSDNTNTLYNNSYSDGAIKSFNTGDNTIVNINLYATSNVAAINTTTWSKIQLTTNNNDSFEPYTGGIASPNPNYEQPVKSAGDNENYLKEEWEQGAYSGSNGVGKIDSNQYVRSKEFSTIEPNKEYTSKCVVNGVEHTQGNIFFYKEDESFISSITNISSTFTTPENAKKVKYNIFKSSGITPEDVDYAKLEKGNKASGYSPYGMGSINEKIQIRNIFDLNGEILYASNTNYIINNNQLKVPSSSGASGYLLYKKVYKSGTYHFSSKLLNGISKRYVIKIFDKENNVVSDLTISGWSYNAYYKAYYKDSDGSFTIPSGYTFIVGFVYLDCTLGEIQLEPGSTESSYVPHEEQDYSIFVQQPMMDDDHFDRKNNKEVHTWIKYVLDGSDGENWSIRNNKFFINDNVNYNLWEKSISPNGKSNIGVISYSVLDNQTGFGLALAYGLRLNLENIDASNGGTIEQLRAYLAEHPITIYVKLKDSAYEKLPCTEEQVEQLENKPSTYKDFTIINSEDETEAYLEVSGIRDINTMFDKVTNAIVSLGGNV